MLFTHMHSHALHMSQLSAVHARDVSILLDTPVEGLITWSRRYSVLSTLPASQCRSIVGRTASMCLTALRSVG